MAVLATSTAETITDKPPRCRRWIPLSVRMFGAMLLIMFVGGALWMGIRFYRQKEVIREVRQANGTVDFEYDAPDWLHESLNDDWLAVFGRISTVTLPFSDTLDAGTTHLIAMRPLPELYIEGGPPVHDLIRSGRLDELRSVIEKHRILLFSREHSYRRTLLHTAVSEGVFDIPQRAELVKLLLDQGLEIDTPAAVGGTGTPLCSAWHPVIVKLLLDHGANVAADGPNDQVLDYTAYRYAQTDEYAHRDEEHDDRTLEIAQLLIVAGAKYDLVSACRLNDLDRVHQLLERGKSAQIQEALRVAAELGRIEIIKLLLEHGADPHEIQNYTPVVYAAIRHPDVLEILFGQGVRLDTPCERRGCAGWTLLHEAAQNGAVESAQYLLSRGIPVETQAESGTTPLHVASTAGHVAVVKLLLSRHANIHAESTDGKTAITYAMFEFEHLVWRKPISQLDNWRKVVELLLAEGVPQDLWTAIALGRIAAVRQMLQENPALATSKDGDGDLPLYWAVNFDQPEIVETLLAAGAEIDAASDRLDSTALHRAARLGRRAIAEILIERHADVNNTDDDGQVPLHRAADAFKPQLVRLLLEAGANPDVKDQVGRTPLDRVRKPFRAYPLTDAEEQDRAETIRLLSERVESVKQPP